MVKSILTPRQLADAIGVSESSVKRWVDDGHIVATRTAGGHRRIAISEVVRYIRENRTEVVRPDLLGLPEVAAVETAALETDDAAGQLFDYLRAGAAAEVRGFLVTRYLDGSSVAEIVDGPLARAMTRIGELWVASPSGILWEHRATQIAIEAMSRFRLLMTPPLAAPVAIGCAPTGDRYILSCLAAATVLEGEGMRAANLGPETPLATLGLGVEESGARLAWLSVSVAADVEKLRRQIGELVVRLAKRGAILVVGGAESPKLALQKSDSLYVGRSMAELEALVQGMRLAPRSTSVPA